ncbi:MAG TPA: translocation/assembly module TamB domain-containing protein [Hyphomonadaceae bacterium]|nr:translocation/assembly module TamB domain-containing protein [Hyphomonadaceae bacterium]HPN04768.1 translocation/assembly module TamB domain-containing protein [Hyphomonadaceae bacterium]
MADAAISPTPEPKRRKLPLWLRIALGLIVAAIVLAGVVVGLRYWITTDGGRAFIASQIDGRKIGPLGSIRIQGLKGDPLEAISIADIALVDDDGVWLRAKDARVEWTPDGLFAGELEIQKINIRTVDVLRQPKVTAPPEQGSGPDIGLSLDEVSIDDLHIAPAIIGSDAHYKIAGGAARRRDASGFARLMLSPLLGPNDRADIAAEWSPAGSLKGTARVVGPADGLIAALVQGPKDQPVAFEGKVDGTLAQFTGGAKLRFGDEQVAAFDIKRDASAASITADVAAGKWPLLAPLAERAGDTMKLTGQTTLANMQQSPASIQITAPAGVIDLATTINFETWAVVQPLQLATTGLDLAMVAPPMAGKVDATGDLQLVDLGDFTWKGNVVANGIAWPSGGAARIATPITVAKDGNVISWNAPAAIIDSGRVDALENLRPARYNAAVRGDFNLRTQIVELYTATISGTPGDTSVRGTYSVRDGRMNFSGTARVARLSDVAPLGGSARSIWSVSQAGANAPIRITADAEGRDVTSSTAALQQLAGREPRVKLAAVVRNGRFVIESGTITGAGVRTNMTGRVADNGDITARAVGALTRSLDLGGATFGAMDFTADITGNTTAPILALRLADGEFTGGGVAITNLGGEANARLGEAITGDFSFRGAYGPRAFLATGRLQGGEGDFRVVNLAASLGDLKLNAPRIAVSKGVVSASFDASGPLAGIAGLERGTLTAKGNLAIGEDMNIDVTGQLANLRAAGMRLDLVTFDADAAGNTATLKARAKGIISAPVDLNFGATATRDDDAWTGQATLNGTIDQLPISTSRPARWAYAPEGWSLDTELSAFRGTLDAKVASAGANASADLRLVGVSLRGLSRVARMTPVNGDVTGQLTYANSGGVATGDFKLDVANANPVGVTTDPVSLAFLGQLRDNIFTASATGEGQGFKLAASSREEMVIGDGFDIALNSNAPLQGQLDLTGRAEQLWALFGPEDQSLRGQIQANVRVAGTASHPDLSGGFQVANGAYDHGETGLRLRDITAAGAFDDNNASLTGLTATDGQGGRLTGEGAIRWDKDVAGSVKLTATNLRALNREERMAIVSGEGNLVLDAEAIRISGDFNVAQARISIEQPAAAQIPTLSGIRRVNFPDRDEDVLPVAASPFQRPMQLNLKITAPRRIVVFGRGLDTEWAADFRVTGQVSDPSIDGTATLVRGDLDLAGKRFTFDTGTIELNGPIRTARINIAAERAASDVTASVVVSGTPVDPKFTLESTPSLPQDEILARVLFGRSAAELSGFEAAQLAAGLAQLAGGNAGFDPVGLVRQATGLDRVSFGAQDGVATVSAGKYIAEDVYLQVGAGGTGGVGAEVEWEPRKEISIISSAQGNGDTKIAVRWKRDY